MNKKILFSIHLLILLLSGFSLMGHCQSLNHNYVIEREMYGDGGSSRETVHYYDGLGRQVQTVRVGHTPKGNSLVESRQYDKSGSISQRWLPVPCDTGADAVSNQCVANYAETFYSDAAPFTRYQYETSPLHRQIQTTGAGIRWHRLHRCVSAQYLVNDTGQDSLNCLLLEVSDTRMLADTFLTVRYVGPYPSGCLRVERVSDEDQGVTLTFRTRSGLKVLERRMLSRKHWQDIYYVYDVADNLTAVLPTPCLATLSTPGQRISSAFGPLQQYGYFYLYDRSNRMRGKKLPGCAWTLFVHDTSGTAVFSQDGVLRSRGQWTFAVSDAFGRICMTGIGKGTYDVLGQHIPDFTVTAMRSSSSSVFPGYHVDDPCGMMPSSAEIHHVWYYDDYSFLYDGSVWRPEGIDLSFVPLTGYSPHHAGSSSSGTRTRLTGETVMVFGMSSKKLFPRVYYYDTEGRIIQRYVCGPSDMIMQESLSYDFTGNVLRRRVSYPSAEIVEEHAYSYDKADRLTLETLSLGGGPAVEVLSRTYDEVGRLLAERYGGDDRLTTCIAYNVRSWPVAMQGSLFSERLYYESPPSGIRSMFGGAVSVCQCSSGSDGTSLSEGYAYIYDILHRLSDATYRGSGNRNYSERYSYDAMGNIVRLQRYGRGPDGYACIDNLSYCYQGNRIVNVSDGAADVYAKDVMHFNDGANETEEYYYDACGRLTFDLNKGIAVSYNDGGYPLQITTRTGARVRYFYTADGQRLATRYETPLSSALSLSVPSVQSHSSSSVSTEIVHFGNLVFRDGKLSMLRFGNGYVEFRDGRADQYRHVYCFRDHLGSVRVAASSLDQLVDVSSYYSYGALYNSYSISGTQPYKYNSKELDRMYGLDIFDYGARWYDPVLARWHVMDSACEEMPYLSPYAYGNCDPVSHIDPDGNSAKLFKIAFKLARTVGKNGVKSLAHGATYIETISDVIDDVSTLTDSNAQIFDRVMAGVSLASVLCPVSVNDVKDGAKLLSETVQKVKKTVSGNSRQSTLAQHAYDIVEVKTGRRVKTGVSGGRIRRDGKSYRAERQVRSWNRNAGYQKYESEITHYESAGEGARAKILEYEKKRAIMLGKELDNRLHKRPRVKD